MAICQPKPHNRASDLLAKLTLNSEHLTGCTQACNSIHKQRRHIQNAAIAANSSSRHDEDNDSRHTRHCTKC